MSTTTPFLTCSLFLGLLLAASAGAQPTCRDTVFVSNNGGSAGGAVYFNIDVVPAGGITVRTMQVNTSSLVAFTVTVYHKAGTAFGSEAMMGLWSIISTGPAIGLGTDMRTPVDVTDFMLPMGTNGIALVFTGASHRYTGTGAGPVTMMFADANITILAGTALNVPFTGTAFSPRVFNGQVCYDVNGSQCAINSPASMATVSGDVIVDFDATHASMATVDATFEYSVDMGMTFQPCTAAGGFSNPIVGIMAPGTAQMFGWNSVADAVGIAVPEPAIIRLGVTDGMSTALCTVDVTVDNVVPPPTCTLVLATASPASGEIPFTLEADILSGSPTVDAGFEYSLDGGATFLLATAAPGSSNPTLGVPTLTPTSFTWDSSADGVGMVAAETMVQLRATVTDPAALTPGTCTTAIFEVDNTALCQITCGDCNLSGGPPVITDALAAAQIAAGLFAPSMAQMGCCDVNTSMSITITDALGIAQTAAGLPVVLTCP